MGYLLRAVDLVFVALALWALVDCATRRADAFPAYGKLTKGKWLAISALAVVVLLFAGLFSSFLGIPAAAAAIVYLVDVRPAVSGAGTDRW